MVKPRKKRNVLYPPRILYFKPQGIPVKNLSVVTLTVDEYEAIRLADHKKLKQEDAAKKMNISRPTFTRLINSARKKTAEAIIDGKAIKIEGGSFIFLKNRIRCLGCGNVWDTKIAPTSNLTCPNCYGSKLEDVGNKLSKPMPGGGRRRHGRNW